MTTLTPRRDAMIAACMAARKAEQALPRPKHRLEEISRDVTHGVLEAMIIPIAEAMDLGASTDKYKTILTHAFASTIMNFSALATGSEKEAQLFAIGVMEELIWRTRTFAERAAEVSVGYEFEEQDTGRPQ